MGGVSRNLLGSMTVLLMALVALGAMAAHPWLAAGLGGMALFRLVVLVRQWNLGKAQKSRRRPPGP